MIEAWQRETEKIKDKISFKTQTRTYPALFCTICRQTEKADGHARIRERARAGAVVGEPSIVFTYSPSGTRPLRGAAGPKD